MITTEVDNNQSSEYTASWMLWSNSIEHEMSLPRSVDNMLTDYVFYPELEWGQFGYRPPENLPLLGAWRDSSGKVFAFLLDASLGNSSLDEKHLLLYVSGEKNAVETIGSKVTSLKAILTKTERKEIQVRHIEQQIEQEKKSPAIARLVKLIGLFTIVVNAFSLYLRELPMPKMPSSFFQEAFQFLIVVVHFSALFLLLVITLIGVGYVFRYGSLILRRF